RAAFVLCHLEGKGVAEAARELGCTPGALAVTLTRARKRLADRLARRGVTLSAALTVGVLARHTARAAVPASVSRTALHAATVASGPSGAWGELSENAVALAEGVIKAMYVTRLKIGAALLLLVLAGVGTGVALGTRLVHAGEGAEVPGGP